MLQMQTTKKIIGVRENFVSYIIVIFQFVLRKWMHVTILSLVQITDDCQVHGPLKHFLCVLFILSLKSLHSSKNQDFGLCSHFSGQNLKLMSSCQHDDIQMIFVTSSQITSRFVTQNYNVLQRKGEINFRRTFQPSELQQHIRRRDFGLAVAYAKEQTSKSMHGSSIVCGQKQQCCKIVNQLHGTRRKIISSLVMLVEQLVNANISVAFNDPSQSLILTQKSPSRLCKKARE